MKWKQFFIGVLIDFRVVRGKVSQRMEEHPDAKWKLPGWRIEQRYATDVLIGNWNEERRVVCEKISFPQLSGETWGELEECIRALTFKDLEKWMRFIIITSLLNYF